MRKVNEIKIDDNHYLFNKDTLYYKEFVSDYRFVRYYSRVIMQKVPIIVKEHNLLEQQISELIKNAIKHGNKKDPSKIIKVWYSFTTEEVRLIVEDQGEGFNDIEAWNEFNKKREECFCNGNVEDMIRYFSYRTSKSTDEDGGNALFAAVEYWNMGVVFNTTRNAVAVGRRINIEEWMKFYNKGVISLMHF
ncbi:MAG: ATP-binding protein [Spirochaetes bacterium]|nr:ATP-binding protein [Spirochaetota bacterium]